MTSDERICRLGIGTWRMGETATSREEEVAAIEFALDHGVRLIDTAERYGDGGAEELVGQAIAGRRDEVSIVTKVSPRNAACGATINACEQSLRRLRTDWIDLYLLHRRGAVPLDETVAAFNELQAQGKIRDWGVSNFDISDLEDLTRIPGGSKVAANEVYYSLSSRWSEWAVLPWCRHHEVRLIAQSPLEKGRLMHEQTLHPVAERHGSTCLQIALAWILHQPNVFAIPKSSSIHHMRENIAAAAITLSASDLDELDAAFPAPTGPSPIEFL